MQHIFPELCNYWSSWIFGFMAACLLGVFTYLNSTGPTTAQAFAQTCLTANAFSEEPTQSGEVNKLAVLKGCII